MGLKPSAVADPGRTASGGPSAVGFVGGAASHSRTLPSASALASVCRSLVNATGAIPPAPPPARCLAGFGRVGSVISQNQTAPSPPATATACPSELKATDETAPV